MTGRQCLRAERRREAAGLRLLRGHPRGAAFGALIGRQLPGLLRGCQLLLVRLQALAKLRRILQPLQLALLCATESSPAALQRLQPVQTALGVLQAALFPRCVSLLLVERAQLTAVGPAEIALTQLLLKLLTALLRGL
ncbi:MAG: hypothetical protein ABWY66_06190, partial [Xanthobacteraceae bacterium]